MPAPEHLPAYVASDSFCGQSEPGTPPRSSPTPPLPPPSPSPTPSPPPSSPRRVVRTNGSSPHNRPMLTSRQLLPPPMSYGMQHRIIAERVPGAPTREQMLAQVYRRVMEGRITKTPKKSNVKTGPGSLSLKLPPSSRDVNMRVQPGPMNTGPPPPNDIPPPNGHPNNGRASAVNSHPGHVSPMAYATLTNSPSQPHRTIPPADQQIARGYPIGPVY